MITMTTDEVMNYVISKYSGNVLLESTGNECIRSDLYPIEDHFIVPHVVMSELKNNNVVNVEKTSTRTLKENKVRGQESWLIDGNCEACRRARYCKKECSKHKYKEKSYRIKPRKMIFLE